MSASQIGKERKMARARNISLGESAQKRLDELIKRSKSESASQVIRDALRFYEFLIEETESGSEFYIREKGKDLTKLRILR